MKVDIESLAAQLSMKDVQALMKRKEKALAKVERLKRKRDKLLDAVRRVEELIEQLTADAAGVKARRVVRKGGRRGRRGRLTLGVLTREYLASVGGDAELKSIVAFVNQRLKRRKATLSEYNAVAGAMRNDPAIKKVSRGVYRLVTKAAEAAPAKAPRGRKKAAAAEQAQAQPQEPAKAKPAGQA